MPEPRTTALVPVKAFAAAKQRLAPVATPQERRQLATALTTRTITRLVAERPTAVVSDDDEVLALATELGAMPIRCSGPGLDLAVTEGLDHLRNSRIDRAIVVHSDLPLLDDLLELDATTGVTIVSDRHGQGTNAIAVPIDADLRWAYGAGSLHRHRASVLRLGLALCRVHRQALCFDLDTPADLRELAAMDLDPTLAAIVRQIAAAAQTTGA